MTMPDTEDYFVFDRAGTPHVVVAVQTEIGGLVAEQTEQNEITEGDIA